MPIRFDSGNNNFGNRGSGGNNRGLIAILLFVLFFVFRKPKIAIPILLIGGLVYYFYSSGTNFVNSNGIFGTGCGIDLDKYDKTSVYEPLAVSSKNSIPTEASLLKHAPKRQNQGQQGSCVGWASAYAARTILEAYTTEKNPDELAFSPAFLYNQIALQGCQGSYMAEALEQMKNVGLVSIKRFPYDENTCANKPGPTLFKEAERNKIRGYSRLSKSGWNYDVDVPALKQNIAHGAPVVIAMNVPESFFYLKKELWEPKTGERKNIKKYGGHAMCAIGYDDNKYGGAVQVMNSWGKSWGDNGIFWIKYTDFQQFVREAYGLYPHKKVVKQTDFEVTFGLVDAASGENIPIKQVRNNLFRTVKSINKKQKFKIEVSNKIECFIYVFGQETDGSSYVLFPYPEEGKKSSKYSPYCGVTGTRHFPSGKASLLPDEIGNTDYMAVIVSTEELDYFDINEKVNRNPGRDYLAKLNRAIGNNQIINPRIKTHSSSVAFQGQSMGSQNAYGVVIAIDKK